jgi:SAM-dependent methyltransferase
MRLNVGPYLKGLATFIPGFYPYVVSLLRPGRTGGTDCARYCYSVWLRHLVFAFANRLPTRPQTVAELGPGDSLGTGIAALLSGAQTYYAFDVVEYATNERNQRMLEELADLFLKREPIPGDSEFPELLPRLESYDFPKHVLPNSRLRSALAKTRIESIRRALAKPKSLNEVRVQYCVPWDDPNAIQAHSVDLILSQAAMEHVEDLRPAYFTLARWLKPTGFISETIDFRSHGTANPWNGHWCYSDWEWKVVQGRRPYLLNREPRSAHLSLLAEAGFQIVGEDPVRCSGGVQRNRLAPRFRQLSAEDVATACTFIQATPVPLSLGSTERLG